MNKICTEIKADLQTINVGDLLREARGEHHVRDLNVIARELCIKPHLLEALEEGKFDSFPSACYATGFLKNYATFLGLDTKDIISKYEQEYAGLNDIVVLTFPEVKKSKFSVGKLLGATSFSVALIIGVWMTSSTFDAQDISNALMVTKAEAPIIVPATVLVEAQEKIVLASITEEEAPSAIFAAVENSIQLKANDDVWVRITNEDGTTIVEQILAKGETFTHPQEAGLVLMTNNAAAISISMGSSNVESLGEQGEIIENMALEHEKLLELSMVH